MHCNKWLHDIVSARLYNNKESTRETILHSNSISTNGYLYLSSSRISFTEIWVITGNTGHYLNGFKGERSTLLELQYSGCNRVGAPHSSYLFKRSCMCLGCLLRKLRKALTGCKSLTQLPLTRHVLPL